MAAQPCLRDRQRRHTIRQSRLPCHGSWWAKVSAALKPRRSRRSSSRQPRSDGHRCQSRSEVLDTTLPYEGYGRVHNNGNSPEFPGRRPGFLDFSVCPLAFPVAWLVWLPSAAASRSFLRCVAGRLSSTAPSSTYAETERDPAFNSTDVNDCLARSWREEPEWYARVLADGGKVE